MYFEFTKQNLKSRELILQRFFEMIPGLSSWGILISMTSLSILKPVIAAMMTIAFLFYWILKLIYMTIFLILSYNRLMIERHSDWMAHLRGIDHLEEYLNSIRKKQGHLSFRDRLSLSIRTKELLTLQKSKDRPPLSNAIYHVVIFPIVKEAGNIVEPGIKSLSQQHFPTNRLLVVFALEERANENIKEEIFALERKYKDKFLEIHTVIHPSDLPGEARVKGANVTYAAKKAAEILKTKNIPFENVILSCLDADTIVSFEYLACLTYYFLITPTRIQSSFQPIPVYHNNIWDVPGFARVIETGSSFFQLIEATNPEKLVTFSSHSMSFKALVDINYWPVDMISDDSAIFWKAYIHFDGQYRVIPLYTTLSMDIAATHSFWQTVQSVYKQKRRWAWGVENFPIVMRGFLKSKKISLYDKIRHSFKLFEGHTSWATSGFLLTIISWIPAVFAEKEFTNSVVYYNAPYITHIIFNLASLSLLISIFLSIGLLPEKKTKNSFLTTLGHALEWLFIPLILVIFSSLPALDAQTRLTLGRYMEFWVTDKTRKKSLV